MSRDNASIRRNREPRAKAFAFVINQFLALAKEQYQEPEDDKERSIVTYWQCFFPQIRGRAYTRSNYEKEKDPKELFDLLQPGIDAGPETHESFTSGSLFDKACLIGWILRTDEGPFLPLISSPLFEKYFGERTLQTFGLLLTKDFRSPGYLFHEFEECIANIHGLAQLGRPGYTEPWPGGLSRYAHYLLKKSQDPRQLDLKADLVAALMLAALNGPRNYRPDLLIFNKEHVVATDRSSMPAKHAWNVSRDDVDTGSSTAYLTRVTFPTSPADAREWMPCKASMSGEQAELADAGLMSYSLADASEVLLRRATDQGSGASRFTKGQKRMVIPLDCGKVSSEHATLTLEDGAWYLTDLDSTNGTLLVRVNDDRFHLCRAGLAEARENHVRLENGDVICLAPDWTNEQPLQGSPAFVFQLTASKW